MGLRMKILSGFLILAMMLVVAGAWSIYELTSIGTSVQNLLDDNYKSINASKTMIEALEREDSGVLLLLSGKWKEGSSIIEPADKLFQHGLEIAKNNVTIPGEKAHVDAIDEKYLNYRRLWMKPIVDTSHEGDLNWYFQEVHRAFIDVKSSVETLMTMNDQTMYQTASNLKSRAHRALMPGIVAIIAALAFTAIFNYFIHYYVASPIIKVTEGIQKFLKTGEPLHVTIETRDELSHLLSSVQELAAQSGSRDEAVR